MAESNEKGSAAIGCISILVLIFIVFKACSAEKEPGPYNFTDCAAAKRAISEELVDPDSAQFECLKTQLTQDGGRLLSVQVNAKNRMGGYTGRQIWMVSFVGNRYIVIPPSR